VHGRQDFAVDADDIFPLLSSRPHVVAHSYGVLGTLIAAAQRPEDVRSLALIEPPLYDLVPGDRAYKRRMGWSIPWAPTAGNDFKSDFGVSYTPDQVRELMGPALDDPPPGLREIATATGTDVLGYVAEAPSPTSTAFVLDDVVVYHAYTTQGRGVEFLMGYYPILDRAPKGRDEGGRTSAGVGALDPPTRRVLMEAATFSRTPPRSRPAEVALLASLLVVAAAAWAVTGDRMAGMDAGPGTELGGLGWFAVVWVTMMAAMMLPSISPIVLAQARLQIGATPAFVAGYLLTWGAVGALGWALFEGVRPLDLGVLALDEAGPYIAGGAILAAAIYQASPLKSRSLRRCRNPRAFVSEHWRPGRGGALRMGIRHGRVCLASSWALMAALFALGVMSIGWMVLVAALIATEKLLAWRTVATRGMAVLLAVLGIAPAFAPEDVPGLTILGLLAAMEATERMGMESMEPARPMRMEPSGVCCSPRSTGRAGARRAPSRRS
jgi:predicted metal-binding membrane protein